MAPNIQETDLENFREEDDEDLKVFHKTKKATKMDIANVRDRLSVTSKDSEASASENLMSSHALKMGIYTINLGTSFGQKLHTFHMLVLPLIPVIIILAQNTTIFLQYVNDAKEMLAVRKQIAAAIDLSILVQKLQEERAAVALATFLNRSESFDTLKDLQPYALNGYNISRFTLSRTFNETDTVLKNLAVWPTITAFSFFESKLTFQIQHSIFRTKIQEGEKGIFEVVAWYNDINSFLLDYISVSIKDSDVSDFYRYIISFKNLLRSVEFSGKSGAFGLRYLAQGYLEIEYMHEFVRFEMLRKEYLNQTFNFVPGFQDDYRNATQNLFFEEGQDLITQKKTYNSLSTRDGNNEVRFNLDTDTAAIAGTVDYFSQSIEYNHVVNKLVDSLAVDVEEFVQTELDRFIYHRSFPLSIIIVLGFMIPIIIYVTYLSTTSMFQFSALYDEKSEIYRQEKLKTEKLLTDLLPRQIIRQMKKGNIPKPESYESVSIFLCDIVGFTSLSSESTAHQIVDMLNLLYNMFDARIDNWDVYKVETIGDAYMVASGVPEKNDHHALEVSRMGLELLAKLVTFEVPHKPGYRLKMRMGIHSGSVVAGVVGTKIPHYSVFGETVETAGLMESTGESMKIQISTETKELLKAAGGFNIIKRDTTHPKLPDGMVTFWLIGLLAPTEEKSGSTTTAAQS